MTAKNMMNAITSQNAAWTTNNTPPLPLWAILSFALVPSWVMSLWLRPMMALQERLDIHVKAITQRQVLLFAPYDSRFCLSVIAPSSTEISLWPSVTG